MANFNTHLTVALIGSTVLASFGIFTGFYGIFDAIVLTLAGTIGGLLPDIDLNHSKISRIGFGVASAIGAGFAIIIVMHHYPNLPLYALLGGAVTFLVMRFGVFWVFGRVTVHRGMVHSVPYMALVSLLLLNALYDLLQITLNLSWLIAGFLFFGAMIHLILDELYSINLLGLKLKKSFGTAFKFFDKKNPTGYAILYLLLIAVYLYSPTPPTKQLIALILA